MLVFYLTIAALGACLAVLGISVAMTAAAIECVRDWWFGR